VNSTKLWLLISIFWNIQVIASSPEASLAQLITFYKQQSYFFDEMDPNRCWSGAAEALTLSFERPGILVPTSMLQQLAPMGEFRTHPLHPQVGILYPDGKTPLPVYKPSEMTKIWAKASFGRNEFGKFFAHYAGEIKKEMEATTEAMSGCLAGLDLYGGVMDYERFNRIRAAEAETRPAIATVYGFGLWGPRIIFVNLAATELPELKFGGTIMSVNGHNSRMALTTQVEAWLKPNKEDLNLSIHGLDTPIRVKHDSIKTGRLNDSLTMENNIHWIRLKTFLGEPVTFLKGAATQKANGIVIDLRDNSGGFLREATKAAGLFLPKKSTIHFLQTRKGLETVSTEEDPIVDSTIPMIILVNRSTYGAAEIFATALKNRPRTLLVGEATAGGFSLQQVRILGKHLIKYSTSYYLTAEKESLQDTGLIPDIEWEKYQPLPIEEIWPHMIRKPSIAAEKPSQSRRKWLERILAKKPPHPGRAEESRRGQIIQLIESIRNHRT